MMSRPDFLPLEERVNYLYKKDYFARDSFTEQEITRLETVNFHYFLGYARNFRELHFTGRLKGEKTPDRVFRLIDVDAKVSEALYTGIRNAEWLLRHYLVQAYCEKFDARGSFLDYKNYLELGGEYTNEHLAYGLMNDILGYGETYIVEQLNEAGRALKYQPPKRCTPDNWDQCRKLAEDLTIWSVVDSFSLGRLVKLIQRCDNTPDVKDRIWRKIAVSMDISANRFDPGMESLRSLRNLISHQSRLWARPTTNTASKKGQFRKKIARCHHKAMLPAFYNVASFQGTTEKRLAFAERLESIINDEADYTFSVSYFGPSTKDNSHHAE